MVDHLYHFLSHFLSVQFCVPSTIVCSCMNVETHVWLSDLWTIYIYLYGSTEKEKGMPLIFVETHRRLHSVGLFVNQILPILKGFEVTYNLKNCTHAYKQWK